MSDHVAEFGYPNPRDVRSVVSHVVRQTLDGLTDHEQLVEKRIVEQRIVETARETRSLDARRFS